MKQQNYHPLLSDETKMFITPNHEPVARTIVCAANRIGDVILCGARHWDKVMQKQANAMGLTGGGEEQGFIDQWGNFLSRVEAMEIVKANKQSFDIDRNRGDSVLYSEGLY